ncbi:MAG: phycocyanobilin lyase [Leptolyngbya foveolarum]|uniref:Phycocyanobilin lyase n=1 Tax=Leptolyngbya foveolarum TaxID=47253 RepID=A0A2W4VCB8_9CYAN|nr:MAG: phycocyanobilin lyase [Leptolyngbya foveolarum]
MTSPHQYASGAAAPQLTAAQAIANLNQRDDQSDRYYAAWWLGRFEVDEPEAIAALLLALQDEDNRDTDGGYPLRRNAARALGKLKDSSAVPALIDCLKCDDYYVREAAAQSLASLNAKESVVPLVVLLEGGVDAAVEVPSKPHLVQPYNAILEALGSLGNAETGAIVAPFLAHEVPQVKNAAARAMYQLTGEGHYTQALLDTLRCDDLQLRRSALLDLGEVGYLPAAAAIADTLAENSIKLIAMKGLLEKQISRSGKLLSDEACEVMALMDSLL